MWFLTPLFDGMFGVDSACQLNPRLELNRWQIKPLYLLRTMFWITYEKDASHLP